MTDIVERLRAWEALEANDEAAMLTEAADEIERLRAALESIAANTCCDTCQEAALVARAALSVECEHDWVSNGVWVYCRKCKHSQSEYINPPEQTSPMRDKETGNVATD